MGPFPLKGLPWPIRTPRGANALDGTNKGTQGLLAAERAFEEECINSSSFSISLAREKEEEIKLKSDKLTWHGRDP